MTRIAAVLTSLCLIAGCSTYSLEELRKAELQGSPFHQALAREYMAFSTIKEHNHDWVDSWHFADKGLVAAYGHDVAPEILNERDLPAESLPELEAARDALITALSPGALNAQPELAARAYMQFDCWVEYQEDRWQDTKIAECRDGFHDALGQLGSASQPASKKTDTTSYLILFDWNRSSLNATGKSVIADIAQTLSGETDYEVVLQGHTDTTGLEKYNLVLSRKRAETVASALEAYGIEPGRIKIFAFGESDPKVPTADNEETPQNRRVEIFIQ